MKLHLLQTLGVLVENIFPMRKDAKLVAAASETDMLNLRSNSSSSQLYLLPYQAPLVRACIHELKFHQNQKALALLQSVLQQYFSQQTTTVIVIPIPLSKKRRRERGFNQTELLTNTLTGRPNITIAKDILIKTLDTKPQTALSRAERLTNVREAFAVTKRADQLPGKHVVLLDDVTTTGATLAAAKAQLLPHSPASITCLAVAH